MPADLITAATADMLATTNGRRGNESSATWTTSSGGIDTFRSDMEELEDRSPFVDEYNRLAKKSGLRPMVPDKECRAYQPDHQSISNQPLQKRGWFSRHFRREALIGTRASSSPVARSVRKPSSKRSLSDLAAQFMHPKRDGFKDEDLQTLVRLCGQSKLYLPSDYAPASLVLPTCLRATAQFLVQHGIKAKGIFRIPGSSKTIQAIYDYYCPSTQDEADKIDGTVSSPNLPLHLEASVHDVAGTFKRFLEGLPGGILGSLSVFDALVAINSQLIPEPEITRTKQSKLRARLIALAIGSLKSQYRRELICAVFGLLCLIGRTAERAPREDEQGRPLPTSDLMGYRALGQVFGPLLVGDLLNLYSMRLAHPDSGLVLLPLSPPKSRKERRKSKAAEDVHSTATEVDKVAVANDISEMLITHWREVVKHIKNLEGLRKQNEEQLYKIYQSQSPTKTLRPSVSATFISRDTSTEWRETRPHSVNTNLAGSPMPRTRSFSSQKPPVLVTEPKHVLTHPTEYGVHRTAKRDHPSLFVKRKRPSTGQLAPSNRLGGRASHATLSPPAEESPTAGPAPQPRSNLKPRRSLSADGNAAHDPELEGSVHQATIREGSTNEQRIIRSPAPRSPVRCSPISRSASRDAIRSDESIPPVGTTADMAMREPHRSFPGPVTVAGLRRSHGRGSHRGGPRHIMHHGRHSGQAIGGFGIESNIGTASPTESPKRTERQSHAQIVHGGDNSTERLGPLQALESEPPGSPGPRDSHSATLPSHPQITDVLVTPGTGRLRSDHSFDSGYFPDAEQVVLFPHGPGRSTVARRIIEPETPAIIGAFPESNPFCQRPSKGSLGRTENTPMEEGPQKVDNQPLQPAGPFEGSKNRPSSEHGRSLSPIEGSTLLSEPRQAAGSSSRHTSWLRRISSGKSAKERQPPGPIPTPVVEDVSSLKDASGRATVEAASVTEDAQEKASPAGPLSGVKAMAAMFETVWNNPASLTSQLMGPRKSRSMGNTSAQFTPNGTPPDRPMAGRSSSAVSRKVSELQQQLSTVGRDENVQRGRTLTRETRTDASAGQPTRSINRASTISLSQTPGSQPDIRVTHPSISLPHEVHQYQQPRLLTPGRMTPGIEQPPIARHISHRIPPRSATPSSRDSSPLPTGRNSPASIPLPGGTAALYAQVRHLQRQLTAKTEETIHLRRQIEALEGGNGVGTLSERLRNAEREARLWRERALAAEMRVAVFEKFLGRVRQLRDREKEKGKEICRAAGGGRDVEEALEGLDSAIIAGQGGDGQVSSSSKYSTDTEDGEVFRGRLRQRLLDMDREREKLEEEVYDEDEEAEILDAMAREEVGDGKALQSSLMVAAREVLEYEDMRRWLSGTR